MELLGKTNAEYWWNLSPNEQLTVYQKICKFADDPINMSIDMNTIYRKIVGEHNNGVN